MCVCVSERRFDRQLEAELPSFLVLVWHMTFPDEHEHTVLRSVCQCRPSSTSCPSHTHRCLTHSHPSRCFTRACRSTFCYSAKKRKKKKQNVQSCLITSSFITHMFRCSHYLSFDHVKHISQLFQPLLQLDKMVISLCLRSRFYSLKRSWRPQYHSSLQLITLEVLGIMAGFVF